MLGYGYYFDPTYLLVIIGAVLSIWASSRVNSTYNKYSRVRSMTGMTGAEAARMILTDSAMFGWSMFRAALPTIMIPGPRCYACRIPPMAREV